MSYNQHSVLVLGSDVISSALYPHQGTISNTSVVHTNQKQDLSFVSPNQSGNTELVKMSLVIYL